MPFSGNRIWELYSIRVVLFEVFKILVGPLIAARAGWFYQVEESISKPKWFI